MNFIKHTQAQAVLGERYKITPPHQKQAQNKGAAPEKENNSSRKIK
jgi:hypothetical protein